MQKSVIDLVRDQPRAVVDRLYLGKGSGAPSENTGVVSFNIHSSQAIFQSLSSHAKLIVMRVLYLKQSFMLSEVTLSLVPEGDKQRNLILEELISLYILIPSRTGDQLEVEEIDVAMVVDEFTSEENQSKYVHLLSKVPYIVNPSFQQSFQSALLHPQQPWQVSRLEEDPLPPSEFEIVQNMQSKWQKMLGLIVGMVSPFDFENKVVVPFVYKTGLMAPKSGANGGGGGDALEITDKGYEFMLKNMSSQLWDFVVAALQQSSDLVDALSFLFALAYATEHQAYSVAQLTKPQRQLMFELSEVGVIFLRHKKSGFFYPTAAAIQLVFGVSSSTASSSSSSSHALEAPSTSSISSKAATIPVMIGSSHTQQTTQQLLDQALLRAQQQQHLYQQLHIIVETNLQVIAYISHPLHVALLKIFVDVSVQLPNMLLGRFTRDKCKQAFRMGMSTARILDFLSAHVHPYIQTKRHLAAVAAAASSSSSAGITGTTGAGNHAVIPANVVDQLQLWENELSRIHYTDALVVDLRDHLFLSQERFQELVSDLTSAHCVLWVSSNGEKMLACRNSDQAIAMIQRFIKERVPVYSY
jgi:hypothetical protein